MFTNELKFVGVLERPLVDMTADRAQHLGVRNNGAVNHRGDDLGIVDKGRMGGCAVAFGGADNHHGQQYQGWHEGGNDHKA
ncbi:MAG: hypothetical protein GX970_06070 [Phyllobacteriaceae bacterium]|nr:hypothetical protein [Phyllobacteriaceae bacterium]